MWKLYARALLNRPDPKRLKQFRPPSLPSGVVESVADFSAEHYQNFCHAVHWQNSKVVHPCYLQVLSFPHQLRCLLQKHTPVSVLGLVHRKNTIRQFGHFSFELPLTFRARFTGISPHRRGWDVNVTVLVSQEKKPCYEATATYLIRTNAPHVGERQPGEVVRSDTFKSFENTTVVSVPSGTGRVYARVSGDWNPIHLSDISAKAFGFKRQIAHGMWTLSRAVSEVYQTEGGETLELDCDFRRPLFLPANIRISVGESKQNTDRALFTVENESGDRTHLSGSLKQK